MNEQEWQACEARELMLNHLTAAASDRKLRHFACASCRRICHFRAASGPAGRVRRASSGRGPLAGHCTQVKRISARSTTGSGCLKQGWQRVIYGPRNSATLLKVLLAFPPIVVIALRHTTTIRPSMTAYSTAVGPSSFFKNSTSETSGRDHMGFPPNGKNCGTVPSRFSLMFPERMQLIPVFGNFWVHRSRCAPPAKTAAVCPNRPWLAAEAIHRLQRGVCDRDTGITTPGLAKSPQSTL